jgi:hypothetical protein
MIEIIDPSYAASCENEWLDASFEYARHYRLCRRCDGHRLCRKGSRLARWADLTHTFAWLAGRG